MLKCGDDAHSLHATRKRWHFFDHQKCIRIATPTSAPAGLLVTYRFQDTFLRKKGCKLHFDEEEEEKDDESAIQDFWKEFKNQNRKYFSTTDILTYLFSVCSRFFLEKEVFCCVLTFGRRAFHKPAKLVFFPNLLIGKSSSFSL